MIFFVAGLTTLLIVLSALCLRLLVVARRDAFLIAALRFSLTNLEQDALESAKTMAALNLGFSEIALLLERYASSIKATSRVRQTHSRPFDAANEALPPAFH